MALPHFYIARPSLLQSITAIVKCVELDEELPLVINESAAQGREGVENQQPMLRVRCGSVLWITCGSVL